MRPRTKFSIIYIIFVFFMMILIQIFIIQLIFPSVKTEQIPYSTFKQLVREERIKSVIIGENIIKAFPKGEEKIKLFITTPVDDPELIKELDKYKVEYTGVYESPWAKEVFSWVLPLVLFFFIWAFLFRKIGPGTGVMTFGKSGAKLYAETDVKVTFEDVAGVDEAKEELKEIVEFLKAPQRFQQLGGKLPKGVLLVGPPGTGKTLLARAVAGEAKVPFFYISGSSFVEMFVGVGAARVRDLFTQAMEKAPCIVFIDELDAVGKARGLGPSINDEREQTLNQLLVEMDGFDTKRGVIIMAATNRPEILDPALLRPGRFDRQILVDRPDIKGREEILKVHTKKVKLGKDVDLKVIAGRTAGFVGADLANVVNEAALLAARKGKQEVGMEEFEEAIDRILAGLEKKNRIINKKEREIVACHESGHAIVAESLPTAERVHRVSIIPRGISALGYTLQLPTEDRYLMTKGELIEKLCVLLGGRAAEEIVFKEISTGAQNDLQRATDIARKMVVNYGMSETLGPITFGRGGDLTFLKTDGLMNRSEYSEKTAIEIDEEVKRIINQAYQKAKDILERKKDKLHKLSSLLLKKEVLEGDELRKVLK
ncbi:cell division protein FtsH [Candidatus Aerophobetes bacterium]|uniref:ATP-dependent zinc metalloprotease FtsH n=1 Tax=Aerophobetes bacterium TaxID=2030807 RepID=A0A662DLM8_UNCAE|nr:MAG: cell division protein FtsH [Candidatus Aerophobetes bacterium]